MDTCCIANEGAHSDYIPKKNCGIKHGISGEDVTVRSE